MIPHDPGPRLAVPDDAATVAGLLHDFNLEFGSPSPGPEVLAERLTRLLSGSETFAVLAGEPAVALALLTLRPNVWYAGRVALLDEMYVRPERRDRGIGSAVLDLALATARQRQVDLVEINVDEADSDAMRFYERHGFTGIEPETGERALYFHRELG